MEIYKCSRVMPQRLHSNAETLRLTGKDRLFFTLSTIIKSKFIFCNWNLKFLFNLL